MRTTIEYLAVPLIIFVAVIAAGLVFRRVAFARLRKWSSHTNTGMDDVLVESLHGPVLLWIVMLAISLATRNSDLPDDIAFWPFRILRILWILSLTIVAVRLAKRFVRKMSTRDGVNLPMGSLTETLAALAVGSFGALALLRAFDIDITPYLTALGVGGLAVALALQDTLANLFSGFYVSASREIRVGDYLELESGQQGWVTDIGWRSTKILKRSNKVVTIPNKKIAESIVTNYNLPEAPMVLRIPVGVSYSSQPRHVERTLLEAAAAVSETDADLLRDPAPLVLFLGFGDFALNFTLICQIADAQAEFRVQTELHYKIFELFQREGIQIPFPIRTVELRNKPETQSSVEAQRLDPSAGGERPE